MELQGAGADSKSRDDRWEFVAGLANKEMTGKDIYQEFSFYVIKISV